MLNIYIPAISYLRLPVGPLLINKHLTKAWSLLPGTSAQKEGKLFLQGLTWSTQPLLQKLKDLGASFTLAFTILFQQGPVEGRCDGWWVSQRGSPRTPLKRAHQRWDPTDWDMQQCPGSKQHNRAWAGIRRIALIYHFWIILQISVYLVDLLSAGSWRGGRAHGVSSTVAASCQRLVLSQLLNSHRKADCMLLTTPFIWNNAFLLFCRQPVSA